MSGSAYSSNSRTKHKRLVSADISDCDDGPICRMLRAVESVETGDEVHFPCRDPIMVRGIYLVYGDHGILITTKETQPLTAARSLLSITALYQLSFPWAASLRWMLRARRRKAAIQRGEFNQKGVSKTPRFPWKSQLSTLPAAA